MGCNYRISLFGLPRVEQAGAPITDFESRKALALLAYLVVTAQPVDRSHLADLLWQDKSERRGRGNLRRVLHNLSALLPECIQADRQTIQFQAGSTCWVDLYEFAIGVKGGSLAQVAEVVSLYRGEFMAGFYLDGCPDFESWLVRQRESWRGQQLTALERLIAHHIAQGDDEQVRLLLEQLLVVEPWREAAHRRLMSLLAASGRRGAALAQYETCRRVLAEALDVEPGPETAALYEQIRDGTVIRQRAAGSASPLAGPAHNLPAQLTPLVGRQRELTDLARLLADPARRLITIVGAGGVGKSHLALQVARDHLEHYPQGVYVVPLAPLSEPERIVPAIAEAIDYPLQADGRSPDQQLQDFLRHKQVLLVLDNFEHLLAGVAQVVDLLEAATGLTVLATARTRLGVQGEQLYRLSGLTYPDEKSRFEPDQGGENGRYEAMVLFEQSARRIQPTFELTTGNLAAVARICRLVRGMPLALLLASAWMELLTPAEIAAEIEGSFEFLQAELRNLPPRQQSLRIVFEHSWDLLSEQGQRIFAQLSIFRGGFTAAAARAVTGASLVDLKELTGKSLLHRPAIGRYELHELLRQFAAQKLAESPADERAARDRHSAYYTAFLGRREDDLKSSRQKTALAEIDRESENIRVAWQWAAQRRQFGHLDQALDSLGWYYEWRGWYQEGEQACWLATETLTATQSEAEQRVLIRLQTWQASFNRLLGHPELAGRIRRLLDEPILAAEGSQAERAAALLEVGQQTNNIAEARGWFEQGIALYRSLSDHWGMAWGLYLLGLRIYYQIGSITEGREFLEQSLRLFRGLGDRRGIAGTLEGLGFVALLRGETESGEPRLREALAIRRDLDDRAAIVRGLGMLSAGFVNNGRLVEAYDLAAEAIEIGRELGNPISMLGAEITLGWASVYLGWYDVARSHGESGLRLSQAVSDQSRISFALWQLGHIAVGEGNYTQAERLLQESLAIHRTIGERSRRRDVVASLGYAVWGLGRIRQARQCLREVLSVAQENSFILTKVLALPLAALLLIEGQRPAEAVELYALAARHPLVANALWFEDVVGRHIATAAAELSADVVRAAQERGWSRDLDTTITALLAEFESVD